MVSYSTTTVLRQVGKASQRLFPRGLSQSMALAHVGFLVGWHRFCYTSLCWEERKRSWEQHRRRKIVCAEPLFMHSSGPRITAAMTCTRRGNFRSLFGQKTEMRG